MVKDVLLHALHSSTMLQNTLLLFWLACLTTVLLTCCVTAARGVQGNQQSSRLGV